MVLLLVVILVLALVKFWYMVVGALALYLVWLAVVRVRAAEARETSERLCHARARRDIDEIAFATARAMHEAAARGESVDGTAVEVRR